MTKQKRSLINDGFESVAEAARFLAISKSRMYELLHGGVVTHAKLGGKLVVSRAALREYAAGLLEIGSVCLIYGEARCSPCYGDSSYGLIAFRTLISIWGRK